MSDPKPKPVDEQLPESGDFRTFKELPLDSSDFMDIEHANDDDTVDNKEHPENE